METKHVVWLLAGAAVAVGAYYWWNTSKKTISAKPTAVPLPTSTPVVPSMPIPTVDGSTLTTPAATNMAFASPFFQATRDTNPR